MPAPSHPAAARPTGRAAFSSALLLLAALAAAPLAGQDAAPAEPAPAASPEVIGEVTFADRFRQGGITMWFLLGLSVVGFTFTLERAVRLRRSAFVPPGLDQEARRLWGEGRFDELATLCAERPSTLGRVLTLVLRHRQAPLLELNTLAGDVASREVRSHLQRAYPIAIVATLAPLLGLFGTVIGMVEAFEVVAIAGSLGDASLLAGSISKALVTTAAGLALAIPALGIYHLFRSRTASLSMEFEAVVHDLLTDWYVPAAPPPAAGSGTASGQATPPARH